MNDTCKFSDRLNDPVLLHMRTGFARLQVDQTIEQALAAIRAAPPEGRIIYFYVVDDAAHLKGVVPTRRLLLAPPETQVADVMVRDVVAVGKDASVLDACEFFVLHRLLAFPVVDEERKLLGIVDVELYTDELTDLERRDGSDDLFQLIGVHLTDAQQLSPVVAFGSRFPWLIANIAGGILGAFLSGLFEAELQKAVALALFIPVLLALAESVSIQSVSLSIQAMHGQQLTPRAVVKKLRAEAVTGLLLGLGCGLCVATVALLWLRQSPVVLCLLGGIVGGVTCAAVIGVLTPSVIRLLDREPQVAAGPVTLALTDMITLLIYFSLARWLLW